MNLSLCLSLIWFQRTCDAAFNISAQLWECDFTQLFPSRYPLLWLEAIDKMCEAFIFHSAVWSEVSPELKWFSVHVVKWTETLSLMRCRWLYATWLLHVLLRGASLNGSRNWLCCHYSSPTPNQSAARYQAFRFQNCISFCAILALTETNYLNLATSDLSTSPKHGKGKKFTISKYRC